MRGARARDRFQLPLIQLTQLSSINCYLVREGAKAILATLKPTALVEIFGEQQLKPVAQEVENTIIKIMEEATAK